MRLSGLAAAGVREIRRLEFRYMGLRYFQYGAAEHGSNGLLAWKQSFEFAPYRFRLAASGQW